METSIWTGIPENLPAAAAVALAFLMGGGFNKTVDALRDVSKYAIRMRSEGPQANADRPKDVISDVHTTYTILGELRDVAKAQRVLLMRAENGGQIPTIGKELTSSIAYEVFADGEGSVRERWQKQNLDGEYVELLCRASESPHGLEVEVSGMREGIYRTFCEANEDAFVHLFPIYTTQGAYYYLAVSFGETHTALSTPGYSDAVRVSAAKIASLFDRWHKGHAQR